MKLFGGSGGHRKTPARKTEDRPSRASAPQSAPRQAAPAPGSAPRATAPRPDGKKGAKVKKPLTRQQRTRRIVISVVVVLALLAGLTAAAVWFIRPPQANDPTIKDKENGDKINVDSLLNSGTRISDVFTFVVGAVDEDETRTDALMVATMDIKKKNINIMNIPRDTMCNNGVTGAARKINAAYGMSKGIEQTKKEIERLMGFQPDKYVIVNFDGIAAIVDAIGGVDYEIPFRMQYDDPSQNLHIDLYAGMHHLTGKQTVEFLRWRHNNDYSMQYANGDEGRVENQQKFLKALAKEVFQLKNVPNIPKIAEAVFQNVKTDLTAGELLWMGMQAVQIKNENIQFFTLPGYGQMSTAGSSTAYSFFFPYYKETLELVNQYFNPYEEEITTLDIVGGPESYSGGSVTYDPDDNDVWGDTTGGSSSGGDDSGGDSSGGDTSGGDSSGGDTSGGDTSGGDSSGGGDSSSGGDSSGGDTSGGDTSGGDSSGSGSTGGDTSGGDAGGDTSGGDSSGGGSTDSGTAPPVDPEA